MTCQIYNLKCPSPFVLQYSSGWGIFNCHHAQQNVSDFFLFFPKGIYVHNSYSMYLYM